MYYNLGYTCTYATCNDTHAGVLRSLEAGLSPHRVDGCCFLVVMAQEERMTAVAARKTSAKPAGEDWRVACGRWKKKNSGWYDEGKRCTAGLVLGTSHRGCVGYGVLTPDFLFKVHDFFCG